MWLADRTGRLGHRVADAPYDTKDHRFNDGRADAQGRFWAGTMNEKRDASSARLYRLSSDLDLVPVLEGFGFLSDEDRRAIFHENPVRLVPGLKALA